MNTYNPNHQHQKSFALVGQKAIVMNSNQKILVLQRSEKSGLGSKWSLPGGALEHSEEPFASIQREIAEETQLSVINLKPFHVKTTINSDGEFVVMIGYFCEPLAENVILNWEHDDFRWVTKSEALELDLTVDGRIFLENFHF